MTTLHEVAHRATADMAGGLVLPSHQESACRLAEILRAHGVEETSAIHLFFVPGRIEILGKHTDYAGGRSLLAATEQGLLIAAAPRADPIVRFHDLTRNLRGTLRLSSDQAPPTNWLRYPAAAVAGLRQGFPDFSTGAELAFVNKLPAAAGLSTSSVLIVAVHLALAAVNGLEQEPDYRSLFSSPEILASYLGAVERGSAWEHLPGTRGVGTLGGSEDHTAILCCRAQELRQYSYLPTRLEAAVPMPPDHCFAIAFCGVQASKAGSARDAYNRASLLATAATETWNHVTGRDEPHLAGAIEAAPGGLEQVLDALARGRPADFSTADVSLRTRHFHLESEILLPAAAAALESGDLQGFGGLVDRSQEAAEEMLGNQIRETRYLASNARELGAVASSAFGAGFGGSVWALVHQTRSAGFLETWKDQYNSCFPRHKDAADFFCTSAGGGARRLA